jgi:hypothetical protein
MKKTQKSKTEIDELQAEYRFDYQKAKPNRFADHPKENCIVILDPDIAEVFTTPESVNDVLRALISTMPTLKKQNPRVE